MLDPGRARTKIGPLWTYARDDRPWGGADPPAVVYVYAPDRTVSQPITHLVGFKGVLRVDGYRALAQKGDVNLIFCWSHVRRRFYERTVADASPIVTEAIQRVALFYAIEKEIRGRSPDERCAVRQERSRPVLAELEPWLRARLALVARRASSPKQSVRPLRRFGWRRRKLGGHRNENCKLSCVDPYAYLADVLTKIVNGYLNSAIDICYLGLTPATTSSNKWPENGAYSVCVAPASAIAMAFLIRNSRTKALVAQRPLHPPLETRQFCSRQQRLIALQVSPRALRFAAVRKAPPLLAPRLREGMPQAASANRQRRWHRPLRGLPLGKQSTED